MKLETAIKQIRKECEFLGLNFTETMEFIQKYPLANNPKTVEAYKIIVAESAKSFIPVA